MKKNSNVDMLSGSLFKNIWKFAIPFMLTTLVQHLYNAADLMVIGQFSDNDQALAGIGATGPITNLVLNFFLGLSAGISITVGRSIGAKDHERVQKSVHTAMTLSVVAGIFLSICGIILTVPLLKLTDVPTEVIPQAKIYMQIIFIGKFPSLIYNFGAAILRANGDSRRPMYIVMISGVINILLNVFFVVVFKMDAEGVALATLFSQTFTAIAIIILLRNEEGATRLNVKSLKIYKEEFFDIVKIGFPSGIQNTIFSISNVIVQSSINYFGPVAMKGSAAAASIGTFLNAAVSAFYQVTVAFTSQNVGAGQYQRIKKLIAWCFLDVTVIWLIEASAVLLFKETLIGLYAPGDLDALSWGVKRLIYVGCFYGLLGYMNIMSGVLRGMGYSFTCMISSICGVCGIRIVWVLTVFERYKTFEMLFVCFPLSWLGTTVFHCIMYKISMKRLLAKSDSETPCTKT